MGNLPISERLKVISGLISKRRELKESLEFHREILQLQQEVDNTPTKGTKEGLNQSMVANLQEKSLSAKRPITHFIDPSTFDRDVLLVLCKKIAKTFIERKADPEGFKKFMELMESNRVDLLKFIEAILRENDVYIREYAEKLSIQPPLLLYAISILVQPYLEEIARKIDTPFSEKWWQTSCPVCGRTPIIARVMKRKRYLVCTFCGAEYLSDYFVCAHCGNTDPYTLKYMFVKGKPEFQIDFCVKCKHYIKVVLEEKLKEPVPRGLEDLLTINLDLTAKGAGLVRD